MSCSCKNPALPIMLRVFKALDAMIEADGQIDCETGPSLEAMDMYDAAVGDAMQVYQELKALRGVVSIGFDPLPPRFLENGRVQ